MMFGKFENMVTNNIPSKENRKKVIIPDSELKFEYSRSGGAGGQNVNKVSTKVLIKWNFLDSGILNDNQKQLLAEKLKSRISEEGDIAIYAQDTRSQTQNKELAIKRLNELVSKAIYIPPKRKSTKTPKRSKEKRLKEKKTTSEKKEWRKKVKW